MPQVWKPYSENSCPKAWLWWCFTSIISNSKNFKNFPWETPAYKIKGVFAFAFSLHLRTSIQREAAQNTSYIKGNTNSGARLLIWGPTFAIKLCDADKLLKLFEFGGEWIQVSEKVMPPHSSTLAWKIPWTEEPGTLQSMGLWRVGHNWATMMESVSCPHETTTTL